MQPSALQGTALLQGASLLQGAAMCTSRLQPQAPAAAAPHDSLCSPTRQSLPPRVPEAAAPRAGGCCASYRRLRYLPGAWLLFNLPYRLARIRRSQARTHIQLQIQLHDVTHLQLRRSELVQHALVPHAPSPMLYADPRRAPIPRYI